MNRMNAMDCRGPCPDFKDYGHYAFDGARIAMIDGYTPPPNGHHPIRRRIRRLPITPKIGGFGAATLDPKVVAALHKLAIDLGNSCTAAWKAVEAGTGFFSTAWQKFVGSESAASAGRSAAAAQCSLATAIKGRVDKIIATNDINAATQLLAEAKMGKWVDITQLQETMNFITLTGGVKYIAEESAKDIKNPFGMPIWVWGLGAIGLYVVLTKR